MLAVIFEVVPTADGKSEYLEIAAGLKEHLASMPGFISIERFQSFSNPDKLLSLSFWESEESIEQWRSFEEHYLAQTRGRAALFKEYRIRVGGIIRDYAFVQSQPSIG